LAAPRPEEIEHAIELMTSFAGRTGLVGQAAPHRYLWTDAFAVCNFLGLARATGEGRYTALALRLVDQVHHVLGTHRPDDPRSGWISGLRAKEGEEHPTRSGLRIGKPLPERKASEPFDDQLEWERDGQYFHYLTKWMHALSQVHLWTGQARYNAWARELAKAAHDGFVQMDGSRPRMVWKMSTDLSRPLVASMGHHDPLDGFVTCMQLQTMKPAQSPDLTREAADYALMLVGQDWATADPLGLGGLLVDASRVVQLMQLGSLAGGDLLEALLAAALRGLATYSRQGELSRPASRRLAFRELGLAIGLGAVPLIEAGLKTANVLSSSSSKTDEQRVALSFYAELGAQIRSFWLVPANRETRVWFEHQDINDVMLATSLVPAGFLSMAAANGSR
jgi:hypothetical protein